MDLNLYWREFTRDGTDDVDHVADSAFLSANFVDFFGKWLQQGNNASTASSFDNLVKVFWNGSLADPQLYNIHTFMVADGSFVTAADKPKAKWFEPHVRLVTIVHLPDTNPFSTSTSQWTLCIVGSSELSSETIFLQVASWNGLAFRFYQRDVISNENAWVYFGTSMDAFGKNAYLGAWNGHVNGACIMKELHQPWIHWFNQASSLDFTACFTNQNVADFTAAPYITQPGQAVLSQLNEGPDVLEPMIITGVDNWFLRRQKADFYDANSQLLPSPSNIPRWVAHLLLTTTINIHAARLDPDGTTFNIPLDHFYDNEMLESGLGGLLDDAPSFSATVSLDDYQTAVNALGLSMLQEVDLITRGPKPPDYLELPITALGGDKRGEVGQKALGFRVVLKNSEGQAPFNILQASHEDAQGVGKMQALKKLGPDQWLGLFSINTFNALVMLDFWNPVYSWRRGVLMQYVPQQTTWDGKSYDLESRFIQNVTNSPYVKAKIADSPEYQFIQLLKSDLPTHQQNIANYLAAVQKYLGDKVTMAKALKDYLSLAESRRRIYRPLPLDEFGSSMPYALGIPYNTPFLEMTADAKVQTMPARGIDFLQKWTNSLASVNPGVVPGSPRSHASGPIAIAALPRPSILALPCQSKLESTSTAEALAARGCPYGKQARTRKPAAASPAPSLTTQSATPARSTVCPTWKANVLPLVTTPYWIAEAQRAETGTGWVNAMKYWGSWDLTNYSDVVARSVTIYRHLRSKSMPITSDPSEHWPEEALELFRLWANAGHPFDETSTLAPKMIIPRPIDPPPTYRVRRDIMSMSREELAVYQSKLEGVLGVGQLGSKWQELGLLHAEWCLHYQEATFLWHRAYLRYVETLIDHPIPYWNGYSASSSSPTSHFAGVPRVFFEETYISPHDGSIRPNPLKYALSLDGHSKSPNHTFVTRDPILAQGPSSLKWPEKIRLFSLYHGQISHALSTSAYTSSHTAESFGIPWANIMEFTENNPDANYPFRFDFDGLFEQVHDNFHGWVGPDMADNTYTAFDPIFLSYHANMDRLAGVFMDANPNNQFTSSFPLQPFVENATRLEYDDPRRWIYTTIGDMAKDTRALGYVYDRPADGDVFTPAQEHSRPKASGGRAVSILSRRAFVAPANAKRKKVPYVIFPGVGCTTTSYRIDVFTKQATDLTPDPVCNPDFIGQITRLGMGPGRGGRGGGGPNMRRCRKDEVTRVLSAERVSDRLGIGEGDETEGMVRLVVTDLETGKVALEEEVRELSGVKAEILWLATGE